MNSKVSNVRQIPTLITRIVTIIIATILVMSSSYVSFFGWDDAVEAVSRNVFYRMTAYSYPAPPVTETAVVLINDNSISSFDTYPPKFSTHARFLSAILSYAPKAVFVDFTFIDDRNDPSLEQLVTVIKEYGARNVDFYAVSYRNEFTRNSILPDLKALADAGFLKLVSARLGATVNGSPNYALFSAEDELNTIAYQYVTDFYPAVAQSLRTGAEFEVRWPLPPSPLNCTPHRAGECYSQLLFPPAEWLVSLSPHIEGLEWIKDQYRIRQQYIPYLFADEVANSTLRTIAAEALKGKMVIYGPHFAIVDDKVPTPFYAFDAGAAAEVPGPFFHAMAIENILDLYGDIPYASEKSDAAVVAARFLAVLLCVTASAWCSWRHRYTAPWSIGPRSMLASATIMYVYCSAYAEYFQIAPSTWLGDLLLLWTGQAILVGRIRWGISALNVVRGQGS